MPRPENRSAFLAAVLARALPDATPHRIARAVVAMIAAAKAHKRHAENTCSYAMTEAQEGRAERRLVRLEIDVEFALSKCGVNTQHAAGRVDASLPSTVLGTPRPLRLDFGGDPRGPCGRLVISDMPGDGWGEGYAIYA